MTREQRMMLAARQKRNAAIRKKNKQIIDYKYNPLNLVCASHNVNFIRYYYYMNEADHFRYSHGCPVCVGLIRAKVQLEFNRCSTHGKHRYPKNSRRSNGKAKRGCSKIKTATTIAETGNGI